ncbi:MAG: polysaccharide pyruvyl transferase family protein [Streptosporangiaceae bacterium]
MTGRRPAPPKVGLFGLLGSGNTGNDVSMESVLGYLRDAHPDAEIDAMCGGTETVRARYGINAVPVLWYHKHEHLPPGLAANVLKVLGKGLDAIRTASWVRRHDVVIVPGAGALEATLPVRPMGFPYAMFLLCASGRIFGTKVALVSVGANQINQRSTRWLLNAAARLAFYRSYRDNLSRDAMQKRGLDTTGDRVYPDLAFAAPVPASQPGDMQTVGVGVMGYYGGNDDRREAAQIHAAYVENIKSFTRWLVDSGHKVRLFGGDGKFDEIVAREILADLRNYRPDLDPSWAEVPPVSSFGDLIREIAPVGMVVATRYHNVVCALRLSKPTISLGYSQKFISLMGDMGLSEFCQSANSMDVDHLSRQFTELERQSAQLRQTMAERNAAKMRLIDDQFAVLSELLFPARVPPREPARAAEA